MRAWWVLGLIAGLGVGPGAADDAAPARNGQCAEHPKPRKVARDWKPTPPPSKAKRTQQKRKACAELRDLTQARGRVRLIARLRVAERWRSDLFASDHLEYCLHEDALYANLLRAIERELPASSVVIERRLDGMPFVALSADQAGLRFLCVSQLIEHLNENVTIQLDPVF